MKKKFSIILFIICISVMNVSFLTETVSAETEPVKQEETIPNYNSAEDDTILDRPVFQKDPKAKSTRQITSRLSSIIIKVIGGTLLLIVAVICGSFIWIANMQRKKAKRKKRLSENADVINAVDNFAKRRIR